MPAAPESSPSQSSPSQSSPSQSAESAESTRSESPHETEEKFRSLMEGLRTTLPGTQVLVAFLLIVPFQADFDKLTDVEEVAYYVAFITAMLATVLLIAPSAHQRLRAPETGVRRRSESHLRTTVNLTIAGTGLLGVSIVAVTFVVSSIVVPTAMSVAATVVVATLVAWSWVWLPVVAFDSRS